jgi:hypothetical protein
VRLTRSDEFKKAYQRLTPADRKRVQAALTKFAADPQYPSLQAKKWDKDQWYFRVTRSIRVYYRMLEGQWCELITVGRHDIEKTR